VLPKNDDFEYEVRVNKAALRDFCKRVPKAQAGSQPVIMTVIPDEITVRFEWGGGAMRSEDIASSYGNVKQTTRVGLNASYLLDLLDGLPDGDFFDLLTYGDMAPMAVRECKFLHVLMPCRA
jgi:DNA polymerase III sliding clamp (beta) subunit (PCNA family)